MKAFHDTLNKKLWNNKEIRPEVAKKLKEIATAFIEFLEVPKEAIEDIVLTGSCASYNYTPQSDIDLHLLVDFEKVHKDCPIVGNYLISKKSEFNNNHDIFIYGIPVEVYAEAIDNENVHNGLYSLKSGKWIDEPQKLKPLDNDVAVNAKYKELSAAIKEVADKEEAQQLIDKIKRMRKAGLASEGEFSVENLVFKKLRNEGLIGKLMDIRKEGIDKELSLEEAYGNLIAAIEEMICTSTAVMAPYPVDVVGRPSPFGKGRAKKEKKSHGEKRAPHTEIHEEYEKQSKGTTKPAMYKYSYKKIGKLGQVMEDIALLCEEILR
jgi:predicted nucleotidyltransferase